MANILIEKDQKTIDLEPRGSAKELCYQLGVNPETVLIVKDGILITEEDSVEGAERIELLSVISGG